MTRIMLGSNTTLCGFFARVNLGKQTNRSFVSRLAWTVSPSTISSSELLHKRPFITSFNTYPLKLTLAQKHLRTRIPYNSISSTSQTNKIAMQTDYTLYYVPTPNGKKISLALEELGLSYQVKKISFAEGDQFKSDFVAINPNSKIPALVDHTADDFAVFESGAILEYLAEKTGKLMPKEGKERMDVKMWLYWQMAGFGPMLGQLGFFYIYSKENVPVGKERYLKEALRLYEVLDVQLSKHRYVAGDTYSIADIACYWWSYRAFGIEEIRDQFERFEHVKRWQNEIEQREAVAKVNAIP